MEPHGSKESYSFLKQMWTVEITIEWNNRLKQSFSWVKQRKKNSSSLRLVTSTSVQGHQSQFWLHTICLVCLYFCLWTWPVIIDDNDLELFQTILIRCEFCVFSVRFCTLSLEIQQAKKMVFGFVLGHVLMTLWSTLFLNHNLNSSQLFFLYSISLYFLSS